MPIRPFDIQHNEVIDVPDELQQILVDSGLAAKRIDTKDRTVVKDIFTRAGGSIEEAAKQISNVMQRGETDNGRLKAAEMVLKVHEVLQELEEKPVPQITININGSENRTLINLVLPTV